MLRWIGFGLLALLGIAVWYALSSPLRISGEEAKRRLKAREFDKVVDVRTDLEVNTMGSYPDAIHIPAAELSVRAAAQLGKEDRILLYCNTGQRARAAADRLQSLGYKHVNYIAGSYTTLM